MEAIEEAREPRRKLFGFLKGYIEWDDEVDRQLDQEIRAEFEASIARGLFPDRSLGHDGEVPDAQAA